MALDKKLTVAGTQLKVKSAKANTAGIVGASKGDILPGSGLSLREFTPNTVVATAAVGDLLTVVKKPRTQFGINVCRVKTAAGIEGEVFWTELKSNCEVM